MVKRKLALLLTVLITAAAVPSAQLMAAETGPEIITEDTDIFVILTGNLEVGQIVYRIPVDAALEEGTYSGKIITEKLTPISLLLN